MMNQKHNPAGGQTAQSWDNYWQGTGEAGANSKFIMQEMTPNPQGIGTWPTPEIPYPTGDYAWGGTLSVTVNRMPYVGRLKPNVFTAAGYSGHGISTATFAGKVIAEAVTGTADRFDVMASLPTHIFPGGTLLRYPGMVLGMLYFSLKDRL